MTVAPGGGSALQDFRGKAGNAPAPRLSLRVDRGASPAPSQPAGPGVTQTSTTIRGHAARVQTIAHDSAEIPGDLYSLQWTESDVHIEILASFGATLADAKQLAAGLVVHPSDAAIATAADEAGIRAAFSHAYAWGAPASSVLSAIENGPALAHALAMLKQRDPEAARSAKITVRAVSFVDARHATVGYSLTFRTPNSGSAVEGEAGAVKVGSEWKVAQRGYCSVVKLTGVGCPG